MPRALAPAALLSAALACAHGAPGSDFDARCPAAIPGVTVRAVDLPEGAAFEFTAPPAATEEVLARAGQMVERYRDQGGIYSNPRATPTSFARARARLEPMAGGARVALRSEDTWQAAHLRSVVGYWTGRMNALHACPVGMGASGMVAPPH